ncbi:MAG: glycosyltransferase family 2 protein [Crocinitomicaceae bacterium]|nr:glycosyltransferase family 2 protein [Crocinitomicaceae bacterium]
MPAYNEEPTIYKVLEILRDLELIENIQKQIIVIDDCSTDNTCQEVEKFISSNPSIDIQLHKNEKNVGKGGALHKGFALVDGDFTIVQDADLELDPNEFNLLLKPVVDGFADVVYGSRFVGGLPHRSSFFWHSFGNRTVTFFSNMFTNLNLTDTQTCYKLVDTKILKSINLKERRFGFDPEITAKLSRVPKVRIYEVGISYYSRSNAEGKKIGVVDGFRALWCILKYNVFSKK